MHENPIAGLGVVLLCDHDVRQESFRSVLDLDGADRLDATRQERAELGHFELRCAAKNSAKAPALVGPNALSPMRRPVAGSSSQITPSCDVPSRNGVAASNPERRRSRAKPRRVDRMKPLVPGATL